jgi:hypothetical protein
MLPIESFVAKPYCLVRHEGQLRLAYCVKYFGEGFPVGSITGYRIHILTDGGMVEDPAPEPTPIAIKPVDFIRDWGKRPTFQQLEAAREKALAEA